MNSRRSFLQAVATPLSAFQPDPWIEAGAIRKRIAAPSFPSREFLITKFGASPNGASDSTSAIADAIAACSRAGGGRVVIPEGIFQTGPIHLKSGVNLHVASGATLFFSTDDKAYLPPVYTRWEGMECMGYSPLVYAFNQRNIAITGQGTLDGQASPSNWWPWKGRKEYGWNQGGPHQAAARDRLIEACERDLSVSSRIFAEGSMLRPQFVQPYRCANVLIEGVTIINSPMWEINPVLCTNVTVRNVTVRSHGPNNDGCNPESCRDVLIEDCHFDTGDDCIAIKSGRNRDGRRINVPSENILIAGCQMKDGHGGVTIGSEVSGSVRNVFAEKCRMDSPNLDRVLRLKTNAVRGGVIENIHMRDITVGQVADAVLHVDFLYEEGINGDFMPTVRNIRMSGVTCRKSRHAIYLRGFKQSPIQDVILNRCSFENVERPDVLEHVRGLILREVTVNGEVRNSA